MTHAFIVLYEQSDFSLKPAIWLSLDESQADEHYKKTISDLLALHKDSKCSLTFETSPETYNAYGLKQTNLEYNLKDGTKRGIKIIMERIAIHTSGEEM